jgi:hypothetical protein
MDDKIGILTGVVCWMTLVIAGGSANHWSIEEARDALPFRTAGRASQGVFLASVVLSYMLFLCWIKNRFYSNESLAFALFVPVFLSTAYALVVPNLVVAIVFGIATALYFFLGSRFAPQATVFGSHLSHASVSLMSSSTPTDYAGEFPLSEV